MRTIFQKAKKISGQNMKNAKNRFKKSFSFLGIQQFEIEISVEIISPLWFWALLNGFLLFPNSMGLNNKHMCWLSIELFQRPQPDPYLAWTINQALSVKGWSKGIELAMNQGVTPRPRSRFQGKGYRVQYWLLSIWVKCDIWGMIGVKCFWGIEYLTSPPPRPRPQV